MDRTTFDALMRRVARQTTRRAALATLLGGVLLLHAPAASEATKEAERRKDRRKDRRKRDRTRNRPIRAWVDNTAGTGPVLVHHNTRTIFQRCEHRNTVMVPPGALMPFASDTQWLGLMFANRYWLDFFNPTIGLPSVSAAVDGVALPRRQFQWHAGGWTCSPLGRTVLQAKELNQHEIVAFSMEGPVFQVRRNFDTNYKEYTITPPAGL